MNKNNLTNYFLNEALCYLMNASTSPSSFGPATAMMNKVTPGIVIFPENWILYVPTNRFACPAILSAYVDDEELYKIGFISKVGYKNVDNPHIENVIF